VQVNSTHVRQYIITAPVWDKIYRRNILEEHDIWFPERVKYEDVYFAYAYGVFTKSIFFIPKPLYNYRRRSGSIMNQTFGGKPGISIDHLKIVIAFYDFLKNTICWRHTKSGCWSCFSNISTVRFCMKRQSKARKISTALP
jgi:hypothetical protein